MDLQYWIDQFILDRKAQRLATGTLEFYGRNLAHIKRYCDANHVTEVGQVTPQLIRAFLIKFEDDGHKPGGVHAAYRAVKAFLNWYELELDPEGWKNPIKRVKSPRNPMEPIEPVTIEEIAAMLDVCQGGGFTSVRDRAAILFLFDTGVRAREFTALDLGDLDQGTGAILIRKGKGRKSRKVYAGEKTLHALSDYIPLRNPEEAALWQNDEGGRLTYWGLREIMRRRSEKANINTPGLHDFRRGFALNFLRNNPNEIYSLQRLMGHADLQVLRRYLAQTDNDIQQSHKRGSPVDHMPERA